MANARAWRVEVADGVRRGGLRHTERLVMVPDELGVSEQSLSGGGKWEGNHDQVSKTMVGWCLLGQCRCNNGSRFLGVRDDQRTRDGATGVHVQRAAPRALVWQECERRSGEHNLVDLEARGWSTDQFLECV